MLQDERVPILAVGHRVVNYWLIRISVALLPLKQLVFRPIIMIRVRMKL